MHNLEAAMPDEVTSAQRTSYALAIRTKLTAQERLVLSHFEAGLNATQIAARMIVKEGTVGNALSSIYRSLNLNGPSMSHEERREHVKKMWRAFAQLYAIDHKGNLINHVAEPTPIVNQRPTPTSEIVAPAPVSDASMRHLNGDKPMATAPPTAETKTTEARVALRHPENIESVEVVGTAPEHALRLQELILQGYQPEARVIVLVKRR